MEGKREETAFGGDQPQQRGFLKDGHKFTGWKFEEEITLKTTFDLKTKRQN